MHTGCCRYQRSLMLFCCAALVLPAARAEPPAGDPRGAEADDVAQLMARLDDADFATRREAAGRLQQLAAQPQRQAELAARFRRALLAADTSFEVRAHLEPLLRSLPPAPDTDEPPPTADQIEPLLDQLKSDAYAQRNSAVRRLQSMLRHNDLIGPVWLAMKRRAAEGSLSASERRLLEPLLARAHEAWLLAEPGTVELPRPSDDQIARWIDEVAATDESKPVDLFQRTPAERELLDLVIRDDTREQVLALLEQSLTAHRETAGGVKMQYLIDYARPAMAAEAWSGYTNGTVQYLTLGVPQFNDAFAPPRATHFDRIDEQTAHCVSGNSLNEGDYPVRVAIPHPEPGREVMFYLTNLPTPRRRLAYEYYVRRDERWRLQQITERTLDYLLTRQTPLSEVEILMLGQLEPHAVSRFVGKYFEAVPNTHLVATPNGLNNQQTVHAGICAVLSRIGTHEAIPALEKLGRSGTLGKPTYPNRVDIPWVAALAIANRDRWPGLDPWLASLLDEQVPLTTDPDTPPELGASAAGLLLDRHGMSVRPFGLSTAGESVTEVFQFYGYRYSSERDRQDVKRWWQKQQTIAAAARETQSKRAE